jgi:LysM repeat protein
MGNLVSDALRVGKLGVNLAKDAYDIGAEKTLSLLGTDSVKQLGKGLLNKVVDVGVQTNDDLAPEVVNEIRKTVVRALEAGRRGTEYEDYDALPDGTDMGKFVREDFARGGSKVWETVVASPAAQAATTVGRGSIEIDDEGNVFYTDKYNFAAKGSNTGTDNYSELRRAAGKVLTEDEGETTGQAFRIYMGKEKELVGRKVNKGDTLAKIAKEEGIDLDFLTAYNNIANPNKIRVGQRIKIPSEMPQEQVVSSEELLAGDQSLFRGDIGA